MSDRDGPKTSNCENHQLPVVQWVIHVREGFRGFTGS